MTHRPHLLALVMLAACAEAAPRAPSPPSNAATPSPQPAASPAPTVGLPPRPPLGAPPPGGACTEMGCVDGFGINLEPSSKWPAGTYRVQIEADGASQLVEVTLPLRACSGAGSAKSTGASLATISESGCALPAADHGLSSIDFRGAPLKIKVTISRGGAQLIAQDFSPSYKWLQPNGPGCGPQCLRAPAATIRVPL